MKLIRHAGWSVVAVLVCVSTANACPYCETGTGKQVQAGIFNDQFWNNVTLTLLPLFILLGIVALIHFDLSWLWRKAQREANSPALQAPLGD